MRRWCSGQEPPVSNAVSNFYLFCRIFLKKKINTQTFSSPQFPVSTNDTSTTLQRPNGQPFRCTVPAIPSVYYPTNQLFINRHLKVFNISALILSHLHFYISISSHITSSMFIRPAAARFDVSPLLICLKLGDAGRLANISRTGNGLWASVFLCLYPASVLIRFISFFICRRRLYFAPFSRSLDRQKSRTLGVTRYSTCFLFSLGCN